MNARSPRWRFAFRSEAIRESPCFASKASEPQDSFARCASRIIAIENKKGRCAQNASSFFVLIRSFVPLAAGKGTLRFRNLARETVSLRHHFAPIRVCQRRLCARAKRRCVQNASSLFVLIKSFVPLAAGKGTLRFRNLVRETVSLRHHFAPKRVQQRGCRA